MTGALLFPFALVPEAPAPGIPAAPSTLGVWTLGWAARGRAIEQQLGANLAPNFPVIDRFEDGMVTSIKSIDLSAATYQDAARLAARIDTYVDQLVGFEGRTSGPEVITAKDIGGRTLEIAVPEGSVTAAQQAAIEAAQDRAAGLGVSLIIIPF